MFLWTYFIINVQVQLKLTIFSIILHPCVCLVSMENMVNLKFFYTLTIKNLFSPIKSFHFLFYLQMFNTSHTILTRTRKHHTLEDLNPSLPHHRSTNTEDPPLWLLTMHQWVQVELWSWQLTACHAPPSSPTHLSAVFLLPLAQCCQSGHHQPPTHSTPPLNPPDLATTVRHPLRSLSFLIYLFFPQFVTLSSSSHRVYPIYVVNKCFYFDFCLC